MTARFHVPCPFEPGVSLALPEQAARHAGLALRLREGDAIELFDGAGRRASAELTFPEGRACARILETRTVPAPRLRLTVIQALVAEEKLSFVIEKAVELGVGSIVLFRAKRSVVELKGARLEKRLAAWTKRAISACEQSGNDFVPEIRFCGSAQEAFAGETSRAKFILTPREARPLRLEAAPSAAFAVGPEGGFEDEELAQALAAGFTPALLGPRILRTETAALAACAVAQSQAGDF